MVRWRWRGDKTKVLRLPGCEGSPPTFGAFRAAKG